MGMSNQRLIIIYRTSDKGRIKPKLFKERWHYLENMFSVFSKADIVCVADNVDDISINRLEKYPFYSIYRTSLGNSKSFWFAYELALSTYFDYDCVYFLEDDYLHEDGAFQLIFEGLEISDYVTLYDHPDKYSFGVNPELSRRGVEKSYVFNTRDIHWKSTNSTTMTFATKIKTLKKDKLFFALFSKGLSFGKWIYPRWFHDKGLPRDYRLWWSLRTFRKRLLISCIPGKSTHGETDQLSPLWKLE